MSPEFKTPQFNNSEKHPIVKVYTDIKNVKQEIYEYAEFLERLAYTLNISATESKILYILNFMSVQWTPYDMYPDTKLIMEILNEDFENIKTALSDMRAKGIIEEISKPGVKRFQLKQTTKEYYDKASQFLDF